MRPSFARLLALAIAAMLAVPRAVWDGTKWTFKAMFAPPVGAHAEVEDVMDAVAARAAAPVAPSAPVLESGTPPDPVQGPAPEAAPVAKAALYEFDPVLARGRLAARFVEATFTLEAEGDILAEADDVLRAWLLSLNAAEMMAVHRAGAHRVAAHLAGKRLLDDLPEIATEQEYRHYMGQAARITPQRRAEIAEFDAAFEDLIADPEFELKCGV